MNMFLKTCPSVLTAIALLASGAPARAAGPEGRAPDVPLAADPIPERADPAPGPAPATEPGGDEVLRVDGRLLHGTVTDIAEGAYVNLRGPTGPETVPWAEIARVRLDRGAAPPVELSLAGRGFEVDLPVTTDSPYVELLTRDGRPVSLLRLRSAAASARERYSAGFDEACRAPCRRPVHAGARRFFVDSHPWTASKVFELPADQKHFRLLVRPGSVRVRKAGVGLMIGGAVGLALGIFAVSVPGGSRPVDDLGVTLLSLSCLAIPTGGIMFGLSRSRVKVEPLAGPPR